jgi:uncharacterized membrane protein YfcA
MTSYDIEEHENPEKTGDLLPSPITSVLIGLAGGVVGSFLGGGGGIVTVPALDRVTSWPRVRIHGTSTLMNIVIAVIGASIYSLHGGAVDLRTGIGLMCGGLVGAPLGARLASRAPERFLRLLFIFVLLLSGLKLLLDGIQPGNQAIVALLPAQVVPLALLMLLTFLLGMLIGAWSSSMGLGGGLLAVPALVLIFGVSQHAAEGTSLLIMIPNTIVGSMAHLRQRTASLRLGSSMSVGALGGAVLGASAAFLFSNQVLQLIFGCFVLLMALRESYTFSHWIQRAKNIDKRTGV